MKVATRIFLWYHEKYDLTPMGVVAERALRPLIGKQNQDIAPLVVKQLKT